MRNAPPPGKLVRGFAVGVDTAAGLTAGVETLTVLTTGVETTTVLMAGVEMITVPILGVVTLTEVTAGVVINDVLDLESRLMLVELTPSPFTVSEYEKPKLTPPLPPPPTPGTEAPGMPKGLAAALPMSAVIQARNVYGLDMLLTLDVAIFVAMVTLMRSKERRCGKDVS